MMGKGGAVFSLALAVLLVFAGHGYATTKVDIDKARELISERNYELATSLLEEIVKSEPNHVQAQFLLGVTHLQVNSYDIAEKKFQLVERLDPAMRKAVGEAFRDHVIDMLIAGDLESAKAGFTLAMKYYPELKGDVSRACLDRGKALLEGGEEQLAEDLFRFAVAQDSSLNETICDLLFTRAKAATGEESLRLVLASIRYGDKYQEETAKIVLRLANTLDDGKTRARYLEEAGAYIEPKKILLSSIDYYTEKWGSPGRVNLTAVDSWISVDKDKDKNKICYLSGEGLLTRAKGGQSSLEAAIYIPGTYTGQETETEKGYKTQIWFSMDTQPTTVYYWIKD
ncbi:tetratricopeptide repeat protein [bacterium]|nr:MAG: tetratricopeptide repeat protein [bacterium]